MNLSLILAGFLFLGFFLGWRKGLLRIVTGVAGLFVALYIAFQFNATMGAIIDKYTGFAYRVTDFLVEHLPLAGFAAAIPVEYLPDSAASGVENFLSAPHHAAAGALLYVVSFLMLFFLTKLIFSLISRFITKCFDHTLIGPLNRFLGGLLGAFFAAIILGVSLLGLSYFVGDWDIPGVNLGSITYIINKSDVAKSILSLF